MSAALLHIEIIGPIRPHGESPMNVKLLGDPVIITKMIRTAMQARPDIAAAFIASVVDYANQEGFSSGELGKMTKFKK